jgi:hypothetical protein
MQQLVQCYKCGEQNSLGNSFCVRCGEPFHYKCPQCSATISPAYTACPNCNVALDWGIRQEQESELAVTSAEDKSVKKETTQIDETRRTQKLQRKKAMPWIIGFVAIVLCIAIAFAVDSFLQGRLSVGFQKAPSAIEEEIATEITAEELSSAYAADETAADQLYKGNLLKVTGKVNGVNKNLMGVYFVKLSGGGIEAWEIQCMFDEQYGSEVEQLQKNDVVTIKGICDGYYMSIKMKDCILAQ